MTFNRKNVIVTGGSKGIGACIVKFFAIKACTVFNLDIKQPEYDIRNNVRFINTDVSSEKSIINAFKKISSLVTIDILINNAGISVFKPLFDLSQKEWDTVINTNLRSAFFCSKEFAKQHKAKSYGRIVNIASTRHLMSEKNSEAYAASKGGLVSLTHALAMSLQDKNITVNCISPGWINSKKESLSEIDNEQHPTKRVGKPEDIANMCFFLCQPENDFITGQNFYIDGGMTKKMIYAE